MLSVTEVGLTEIPYLKIGHMVRFYVNRVREVLSKTAACKGGNSNMLREETKALLLLAGPFCKCLESEFA